MNASTMNWYGIRSRSNTIYIYAIIATSISKHHTRFSSSDTFNMSAGCPLYLKIISYADVVVPGYL